MATTLAPVKESVKRFHWHALHAGFGRSNAMESDLVSDILLQTRRNLPKRSGSLHSLHEKA